jgi:hypothetical protein
LILGLALAGPLAAVTPTFTVTVTDVPTATPTVTPTTTMVMGEGSWSVVPDTTPFVTGHGGYSAVINFVAGPTAWPATGGLLAVYFPVGLDLPGYGNFYAVPAYASHIGAYGFSGQTATVQIRNLAPGDSIPFYYGYNPTGFAVSTTTSPLVFAVSSNALDISGPVGGVTPNATNVALLVQTPTSTSTPTITASPTESPTYTVSPTVTPTWTESPIGVVQDGKVYVYPNPFNRQKTDKCTIRFAPASDVHITIFNLLGTS